MGGITIKNLSKSYGSYHVSLPAVSGVDITVKENQFLTLLGPSGCGKTTTLRIIAGYVTPDTGSIHVGDRLVSAPNHVVPPDRRGMGMVFQNYAVWPHKTVFENVVFGLKLRGMAKDQARAKVEAALELVNLTGLGERFPNELSGGQQQRVALARSLVVEPEILLLDEPLSNLDAKLREKMRMELKQLQRRTGITFIYVTHDQAEALALSDQIAVMHKGKMQQCGSPQEVYTTPANRLVADFMGLVNFLPGDVVGAGRVRIGGVLFALPTPGLAVGNAVEVAVRPENMTMQQSAVDDSAMLAGTVTDQVFLGNIVEHWVALDIGISLRVQTHPAELHVPGTRVAIAIDGARASVFPQEQTALVAA